MDFQLTMRERQGKSKISPSLLRTIARQWQRLTANRYNGMQHRVMQAYLTLVASVIGVFAVFFLLRHIALTMGSGSALSFLTTTTALIMVFSLALALSLLGSLAITLQLVQPVFNNFEQEHARLSAILGSIADGVVLRNLEGHIILANPAAVELLSTGDGFDPDPLETLDSSTPADSSQRIEVGGRTISISAAIVQTPSQVILGDVLVLRDVTREALTERTKDSFLDHIGHELRTPLTVIKGYVDLIKLGGDQLSPDVHERALSAILNQTGSLARMIDEILDLTNMRSAGEQGMRMERTDLNHLVRAAVEYWEPHFAAAELTPTVEAVEPITVQADPVRLRRAIDALLDNACRFSPEGGSLHLSVRRVNGRVGIAIRDQGVGISRTDLPRVFERFYRGQPVDGDGSPLDVRGVGQGLYTAKTIVEAHGGSIDVQSSAGAGSTFTIWLPTHS